MTHDAVAPWWFIHGANGHDALESGPRDRANGHDAVGMGAGDGRRSLVSVVEPSSLNQAQTLGPQVGRFL